MIIENRYRYTKDIQYLTLKSVLVQESYAAFCQVSCSRCPGLIADSRLHPSDAADDHLKQGEAREKRRKGKEREEETSCSLKTVREVGFIA